MPSICFLITGLNHGGAEVQLVSVAKLLQSRGWKAVVVSMLPSEGRLANELNSVGIAVSSLNMNKGVPDPRAIYRLTVILRRIRPDILHSHMVHANLLGRIVRLLRCAPKLVCTIHSFNEGGWLRQLAYRATDAIPELTTAVSHAVGKEFVRTRSVSRSKMRVLPNGVDMQRFQFDRDARISMRQNLGVGSRFTWLAVGRFESVKDYPNMLRAFSLLRDSHMTLLIAGEGPTKSEVARLIRKFEIADRVKLLGLRSDIPQLMNAADAYVLSSQWEGLPLVLIEAAASGLPIVATRVGGNEEVVLDRKTGFLVTPQDSLSLITAMEHVMSMNEAQMIDMRTAARAHVMTNYSLDAIVTQWEDTYRDLLQPLPTTGLVPLLSKEAASLPR